MAGRADELERLARLVDAGPGPAIGLIGVGLAVLALLVIVLNRVVLSPLARVTRHAVAIGDGADLTARLNLPGEDEIAVLAPEHSEVFVSRAESAFDDHKATLPGDAKALALVLAITNTEGLTQKDGADELGRRLGKAMKAAKAAGKTGHVVYAAP